MRAQSSKQKLAAMGVSMWYSRCVLPGARESDVASFATFEPEDAQSEAVIGAMPGPSAYQSQTPGVGVFADEALLGAVPPEARSLLGHAPGRVEKLEIDNPLVEESSSADSLSEESAVSAIEKQVGGSFRTDSSAQEKVTLSAFEGQNVLILSEAAHGMEEQLELELLGNIIAAWSGRRIEITCRGAFRWPVFNNSRLMTNSSDTHSHYLLRWWESLCPEARACIYFGAEYQAPKNALLALQNKTGWKDEHIFRFDYSLGELLLEPSRKALLWRVLQSLDSPFSLLDK